MSPYVGRSQDRKRNARRRQLNGGHTAESWNAAHPVGSAVRYWPVYPPIDSVPPIDTKTRSEAWTLGDGSVVVSIEGRSGGVCLTHIEVMVDLAKLADLTRREARDPAWGAETRAMYGDRAERLEKLREELPLLDSRRMVWAEKERAALARFEQRQSEDPPPPPKPSGKAARQELTVAGTPVGRLVELGPAPLTEGQRQGLAIAAGLREEES